ncbi:hypothetical protein BATDEDRAFT_36961 [Batrachochytrium dendrobatidis JAM81]|uniref:Anti-proliferative protein domain-containing protein n=2 Tax=Batrachochytrium dendrobatidis TaxID=109871 RepID=F4P3S2_BATDJ|nr:uncharacterized protein BATDEDRAFT_36961 [Batrachochytrium dendrobatidis JAM81]EGF80384.1 hypothetical protein BATDEDRAFT_36961 [Batrachochytrium dendrobatidis JAM81]KAJ8326592.1 transducer of ERBB2 [Batrachochytrium dendrobatidis]KAK5666627.1 transducer of ERBB2 [Batrachochytrium dendrobatidis]OAJ41238.1 hypothetical protein BDEG_24870 [Batrachochytrium dendrobatidis JEL423]|eukprot:XP_006679138.1 hypothetical protein BATDEDRAFT_36961 [Batrachochytrium dendrobatidis JAM81]
MINEIAVAAKFLATLAPAGHQEAFRIALCSALAERLSGHWYPETPNRGSGYRAVTVYSNTPDSLLRSAASAAGISLAELAKSLPAELSLWVDPHHVAYRQGEHGYLLHLWDPQALYSGNAANRQQAQSPTDSSTRSPPKFNGSPITIKPPSPKTAHKYNGSSNAIANISSIAAVSPLNDAGLANATGSNHSMLHYHHQRIATKANTNNSLSSQTVQQSFSASTTSTIKLASQHPNSSAASAITLAA